MALHPHKILLERQTWTPDALYDKGNGARYVATTYQDMWQDISGTSHVTTPGQLVGKLDSRVPGPPLVATADGSRPVAASQGFNTAGNKYLTADSLASLFAGASAHWSITLAIKTTGALSQVLFSICPSASITPHIYMAMSNSTRAGRSQLISYSVSPDVAKTSDGPVLSGKIPFILTINCMGNTVDAWVNGVRQITGALFANNAKSALSLFTVGAFRASSNGNYLPGIFYDIEVVGRALADNEIVELHRHLSNITGVMLNPSATCDIFISCGQSNAAGRGTGGPIVPEGTAYEMYGGAIQRLADPLTGTAGGSCWPSFANKWYSLTGRNAAIIQCGVGGAYLIAGAAPDTWSGTLRNIATTSAIDAILSLSSSNRIGKKYVMWCQGESEGEAYNGTTITDAIYTSSLTSLITYFQANLSIDGFLVSELGARNDGANETNWALIRAAQAAAVAASTGAYMAFSGAKDFPAQGKMSDALHYSQTGYNEMGEALAASTAALLS